jgi:chromosome segregation ATPase
MRHKLNQIKRVRDIRAELRKKEWGHARAELADAQGKLQQLMDHKHGLEQEAIERQNAFNRQSGLLSAPEIMSLKSHIESLRSQAESMIADIKDAEGVRDEAQLVVEEAFKKMRVAQRSVDQLTQIDEKLAVEEAKIFERLEEAENERIVFKKKPVTPPTA